MLRVILFFLKYLIYFKFFLVILVIVFGENVIVFIIVMRLFGCRRLKYFM